MALGIDQAGAQAMAWRHRGDGATPAVISAARQRPVMTSVRWTAITISLQPERLTGKELSDFSAL